MAKKEKPTSKYDISKRKDGRYQVYEVKTNKRVNGLDKAKILVEAGLIKTGLPKAPEAAAAAEGAPAAEAKA